MGEDDASFIGSLKIFLQPFDLFGVDVRNFLAITEVVAVLVWDILFPIIYIIRVEDDEVEVSLVKGIIAVVHTDKLHDFLFRAVIHIMVTQQHVFLAGVILPAFQERFVLFLGHTEVAQLDNEVDLVIVGCTQESTQAFFRIMCYILMKVGDDGERNGFRFFLAGGKAQTDKKG